MVNVTDTSLSEGVALFDLSETSTWEKLYPVLKSLARYFVYSSNISSWKGQENDIVEDVVQEAGRRIIERSQKAERGEVLPIQNMQNMIFSIVRNYCQDLRRRDRRLVRVHPQDAAVQIPVNLAESSTDNIYQEALFNLVAHAVAAFPEKQRRAILIDLANRMSFDTQPTPLQQAFLDTGIDLRQYKQLLPTGTREKSRHVSLVIYAYKRVASAQQIQKYIAPG